MTFPSMTGMEIVKTLYEIGWTYRAATFETAAEIFREACMMTLFDDLWSMMA